MQGRLNNVRALLTESNIDAEAYNLRFDSECLTPQIYKNKKHNVQYSLTFTNFNSFALFSSL